MLLMDKQLAPPRFYVQNHVLPDWNAGTGGTSAQTLRPSCALSALGQARYSANFVSHAHGLTSWSLTGMSKEASHILKLHGCLLARESSIILSCV